MLVCVFSRHSCPKQGAASCKALLTPPPNTLMTGITITITRAAFLPPIPSSANKVPQESIPEEVAARVKDEMLEAFRQALGPAAKLPAPVAHR